MWFQSLTSEKTCESWEIGDRRDIHNDAEIKLECFLALLKKQNHEKEQQALRLGNSRKHGEFQWKILCPHAVTMITQWFIIVKLLKHTTLGRVNLSWTKHGNSVQIKCNNNWCRRGNVYCHSRTCLKIASPFFQGRSR